jgi:hypothetical protein
MNTKPVAWINEYDQIEPFNPDNRQEWIPLYTHAIKTLTDEEILQFRDKVPYSLGSDLINFARAILRKAQDAT